MNHNPEPTIHNPPATAVVVPMGRPGPPPAPLPLPDTGGAIGPCPNCGAAMNAIRGSKAAVCGNCGFKDSCCF